MAHCFGQPISVAREGERLLRFHWRGREYRIAEVLTTWHLRDRWWEAAASASDRQYYRVRCTDEQLFDLYYEAGTEQWILDRAHD